MGWQPIGTAPRGKTEERPGPKGSTVSVFVPDVILTFTSDKRLTFSYWIPEPQRWNMFSKDHPPTMWWDFGEGASMPAVPDA